MLTLPRLLILTCNQIRGKRRNASSGARVKAEIWIVRGGGVAVNHVVSERMDCGNRQPEDKARAAFVPRDFRKCAREKVSNRFADCGEPMPENADSKGLWRRTKNRRRQKTGATLKKNPRKALTRGQLLARRRPIGGENWPP